MKIDLKLYTLILLLVVCVFLSAESDIRLINVSYGHWNVIGEVGQSTIDSLNIFFSNDTLAVTQYKKGIFDDYLNVSSPHSYIKFPKQIIVSTGTPYSYSYWLDTAHEDFIMLSTAQIEALQQNGFCELSVEQCLLLRDLNVIISFSAVKYSDQSDFECSYHSATKRAVDNTIISRTYYNASQSPDNLKDCSISATTADKNGRTIAEFNIASTEIAGTLGGSYRYHFYNTSALPLAKTPYIPFGIGESGFVNEDGTEIVGYPTTLILGNLRPNTADDMVGYYYTNIQIGSDEIDHDKVYSINGYRLSPLNQIDWTNQSGNGASTMEYLVKSVVDQTNDDNEVRKWVISPDGLCSGNTFYLKNELYKEEVINEIGNEVVTYKTLDDKHILTVTGDSTPFQGGERFAYNVYDNKGNLRYIISPEGYDRMTYTNNFVITPEMLDKYVTEYVYDYLNRVVEVRLPENMIYENGILTQNGSLQKVYDIYNREILTQDANLRSNGQWLFTKYDSQGRTILAGILNNSQTRKNLQNIVTADFLAGVYTYCETIDKTTSTGYTNTSFPILSSADCINTINYYDDYDISGCDAPEYEYITDSVGENLFEDTSFYRINGSATVSKTRILNDLVDIEYGTSFNACPTSSNLCLMGDCIDLTGTFTTNEGQCVDILPMEAMWITTVSFYDKYGNVIHTQTYNEQNGLDDQYVTLTYSDYSFDKKLLRGKYYNYSNCNKEEWNNLILLEKRYEYDYLQRLHREYMKVNNEAEILLAENSYDIFGQIDSIRYHSENFLNEDGTPNSHPDFIQTVDYDYSGPDLEDRIKGQLTKINGFGLSYNSLMKLKYHYNPIGLITDYSWQSYEHNDQNSYFVQYEYDSWSQLISADYFTNNSTIEDILDIDVDNISYDKNGNITSIIRKAEDNDTQTPTIDNLLLEYNGNQLQKVTDSAVRSEGFIDGCNDAGITDEYLYDLNGNMVRDLNKDITCSYNYLNLPYHILLDNHNSQGNQINWTYSAGGSKLSKQTISSSGSTEKYDYVNGIIYRNGAPMRISTPYGHLKVSETDISEEFLNIESPAYYYDYKNQVGNVVASYTTDEDGVARIRQEDHYYPFGMRIPGLSVNNSVDNKFLYNNKEFEDEFNLDWYHYGVRFYDPQLGRWHSIDPADEFFSPYVYCHNDPVNFLDPDGAEEVVRHSLAFLGMKRLEAGAILYEITKNYKCSANIETKEDLQAACYATRKTGVSTSALVAKDATKFKWDFTNAKSAIVRSMTDYALDGNRVGVDNCVDALAVMTAIEHRRNTVFGIDTAVNTSLGILVGETTTGLPGKAAEGGASIILKLVGPAEKSFTEAVVDMCDFTGFWDEISTDYQNQKESN